MVTRRGTQACLSTVTRKAAAFLALLHEGGRVDLSAQLLLGLRPAPMPLPTTSAADQQHASAVPERGEPMFWACVREFEAGWYDAHVPDVDDAAGAGDTQQEALLDCIAKLSAEVMRLREAGKPVPAASDITVATAAARALVEEQAQQWPCRTWSMVVLTVDPATVRTLSPEELEALNLLLA